MSANEAWFHRIKSAQRDLIRLCGGIDRASEITSVSSSHIGRMNNPKDAEIMPLPVVIALEADCGEALVTGVMAALNGRRLSDPDEDHRAGAGILVSYADLKRAGADLDAELAVSMADGNFSPSELQRADRKAAAKQEALSNFRASLAAGKATGGARAGLKLVGEGE